MLHVLINDKDELFTGMARIAGLGPAPVFRKPVPGNTIQPVTYTTRAEAEAAREHVTSACRYPCTVADLILKGDVQPPAQTYTVWRGGQGGDYTQVPASELTNSERAEHGLPPAGRDA